MSRSRPRSSIDLGVLLEDERDSTPAHIADAAEKSFDAIPGGKLIPIDRIDTWERQPRKSFDEAGIAELAMSIADSGVLEPLVVRRHPYQPGHYIIIAGHRRLLAARRVRGSENADDRARVEMLPCVIREATDDSAFADALVENLVRKDLTRREMMDAVKALKDEYGWSVLAIARRTGRNQHDLSVLARIAADEDLSQLVVDDIISPTALGRLVEKKNRAARDSIITAIRAGHIRTVADVDAAIEAAHAPISAPSRVSDITTPVVFEEEMPNVLHVGAGGSDITNAPSPPEVDVTRVSGKDRDHLAAPPAAPASGDALARTVPVQERMRRIGPAGTASLSPRFERVLADALSAVRSCLPLDEADKAKGRAFAAEIVALIDATPDPHPNAAQ